MSILITCLVILLIVALMIWLIDMVGAPHPFGVILKVLVVVIALIMILQRAGLV